MKENYQYKNVSTLYHTSRMVNRLETMVLHQNFIKKKFWNLLGQLLTDSLNFSYQHGELSNLQRQAIIRLIQKKDKDRRYIKNWRPISLLNVDTKIASKALALRLEKVLPHIIHGDQYAYVKGRTVFDAVRSIDDIMEFTRTKQIPGLMVAIDFGKAFDSLSWNFF